MKPLDLSHADTPLNVALTYFHSDPFFWRPIPLCAATPPHKHRNKTGELEKCTSPGKRPLELVFTRFRSQATTETEIRHLFTGHRGGVGLVIPDGYFGLDVDRRHGGMESLPILEAAHPDMPDTLRACTGGGGRHLWWRVPAGALLPEEDGDFFSQGFPGIEWKGPGRQLVAPPTVHVDGPKYMWESDRGPGEVEIAEAPAWLLEMLRISKAGDSERRPAGVGKREYPVRTPQDQETFARLWSGVGIALKDGDRAYLCPFHAEEHPSMWVDAQRCVWNCQGTGCPGHQGGGIRQLESLLQEVGLSAGGEGTKGNSHFSIVGATCDNDDDLADDSSLDGGVNAEDAALLAQGRQLAATLFPFALDSKPNLFTFYGMEIAPNGHMVNRRQVLIDDWFNEANRTAKKRRLFSHFYVRFAQAGKMFRLRIALEDWEPGETLNRIAASTKRAAGHHTVWDNAVLRRSFVVLTTYPLRIHAAGGEWLESVPVEDWENELASAIMDVEPHTEKKIPGEKVRLYWSCQDWALRKKVSEKKMVVVGFVDHEVDDKQEAAIAAQNKIATWTREGDPDETWGPDRYFALTKERAAEANLAEPDGAAKEMLRFLHDKLYIYLTDAAYELLYGQEALEERRARRRLSRVKKSYAGSPRD